jgi:hypothetical protein
MPILLDHLIVPSHDRNAGAKFLGELLGVPWEQATGEFAPVYLNDSLTLDFANREQFSSHHYCFNVSHEDFDAIFDRIKARNLAYRSRPRGENDMQLNTRMGGKNLYWDDADGHVWEMLTVSYARPQARAAVASG